MKWLELKLDTSPAGLEAATQLLEEQGITGLVIDDEGDFRDFLEHNHQYWDYVDEELMQEKQGLCRITFYLSDDPEGYHRLAQVRMALSQLKAAHPEYAPLLLTMNNLEDAAENFRLVYNKAWALFSGVRPMTQEEAMQMMKAMKPIIDPDIIFFAYFNDEPIGFFITVPDLNRIIGKFNGKFGLIQKLRLMWELKVRKSCDRIFGIIFGIAPEFHGKGVESAIMARYWHFMMGHQTDIPKRN